MTKQSTMTINSSLLLLLAIAHILLIAGCTKKKQLTLTSDHIIYESIKMPRPGKIECWLDPKSEDLFIWHPDDTDGFIVIQKQRFPKGTKSRREGYVALFKLNAPAVEAAYPQAKIVVKPELFDTKTLELYGANWHLPDKSLIAMLITATGGNVYRIFTYLPNTEGASLKRIEANKALVKIIGGFESATSH